MYLHKTKIWAPGTHTVVTGLSSQLVELKLLLEGRSTGRNTCRTPYDKPQNSRRRAGLFIWIAVHNYSGLTKLRVPNRSGAITLLSQGPPDASVHFAGSEQKAPRQLVPATLHPSKSSVRLWDKLLIANWLDLNQVPQFTPNLCLPIGQTKEDIILLNLTTSGSHLLPDMLWPEGDPNCYPPHIPSFEQIPNSKTYIRGHNCRRLHRGSLQIYLRGWSV
jgi:hypothetical protein